MSQESIRVVLKTYTDGLTVTEISKRVEKHASNVVKMLRKMEDVYIDRWTETKGGGPSNYTAIYVLAEIPEDAPMPDQKK